MGLLSAQLLQSLPWLSIFSGQTYVFYFFYCDFFLIFLKSTGLTEFDKPGNTKGGSITVPLTSCLTGLDSAVWQLTIFVCICKTDKSKPVKQEVNSTVILPPLVFPGQTFVINAIGIS
jgi:hypothetical protein